MNEILSVRKTYHVFFVIIHLVKILMFGRKRFVLFGMVFFIGIMITTSVTSSFLVAGDLPNQVNVSNSPTLEDIEPAIAVVGTVAHLVWTHQVDEENDEIVYSSNTGGSFSNFVNISTNPECDESPAIAVGPNGALHVIWSSQNSSTSKMDLCYANMIGGVWSLPKVIDFNVTADSTDIAISSNGVVHIVYGSYDGIWHIDNHTGAFDSKVQLISNTYSVAGNKINYHPRVAVNSSGKAHVIWRHVHEYGVILEFANSTLMYSLQFNSTTFTIPMNVYYRHKGVHETDITIGTSDMVHLVWTERSDRKVLLWYQNDLVYINVSSGMYLGVPADFSTPIVIRNQGDNYDPSITTDSSGAVHIFWRSGGNLHYANNNAGSFSNASYALLYSKPDVIHYSPDIGVAESNLMITWCSENTDSNETEIYFASGEASELLEGLGPDPGAVIFAPTGVLLLGIIVAAVIHLKKKRRA